jgi:hypothetical protein
MRTTLAAVLLATALTTRVVAATTITQIDPQEGFTFAPTNVTILGTGFTDGAVEVFFGDVKALVLEATPTRLRVRASPPFDPQMRPKLVDVIVRVAGENEVIFHDGFYFSPLAQAGRDDYTMMLVPLTANRVPGAHGSLWSAELRVFNSSEIPLRMPGPETFIVELPVDPAVLVPARLTQQVYLPTPFQSGDGAFLYIPNALLFAPKWSLRVRDISQNASSLGTDVPVVLHSESLGDATLIDVPTDPRYRATLRIYGFTAAPLTIGVRVFREDLDLLIEEYDVELRGIVNVNYEPFPPYPSYLAIDPLTPAVRAAGERVRIELTNYGVNVSPPPPTFWAFVSLTNNETQQVTVVTPK